MSKSSPHGTKEGGGMQRKSLLNNTIMLFLLTGSNYVFGLISVPYLTRVLGAETYGFVGLGNAFYTVIQLILDFGFLLSGTLEIAKHQADHEAVERIASAVLAARVMLIVPVFLVTMPILLNVSRFSNDVPLYLYYFCYAACNSLVPDFLYRGLENMTNVTIRNVIVKSVFVVCVFVFIKSPSQYHLVPIFYMVGALVSLVVMYEHVFRVLKIRFVRVTLKEVWEQMKKSSLYFLSRVASTIFSSMNTIVLGFVSPTGPDLGYYSATNTTVNAGRQIVTPVSNSLFPNIVRTKNYKLMFKVAFWGEVILIGGCLVVGYFAAPLCEFVFGEGYAGMAPMLRIMLPLIPIALLSYLFGWAGLGSLGKDVITNVSVVIGAAFHVVLLGALYLLGMLNTMTICASSVVTQGLIMVIRTVATLKGIREYERGLQGEKA